MAAFEELQVPEGFRLVPLEYAASGLLRPYLIAHAQVTDSSPFITLRSTPDAVVYLGCLADQANSVHDWLELWLQATDTFATAYPSAVGTLTNRDLDYRWRLLVEAMIGEEPKRTLRSGWETGHAPLLVFDEALQPIDTRGWRVCRDEKLLSDSQLPRYQEGLSRFVIGPGEGSGPILPSVGGTLCKHFKAAHALNPHGGGILIRRWAPLSLSDFASALSGRPWKSDFSTPGGSLPLPGIYHELTQDHCLNFSERFFLQPRQGRHSRGLEAFYLKIHALLAAVESVEAVTAHRQLPLLNLTMKHFGVSLADEGRSLAALWTARLHLRDPGAALAQVIETAESRYFLASNKVNLTIYQSSEVRPPHSALGTVRLRQLKMVDGQNDHGVIEGTLVTSEDFRSQSRDLLRLTLGLPGERIHLQGNLVSGQETGQGEYRFRTLPQPLPPKVIAAWKSPESVAPFPETSFSMIPLLASPCDLYSLGVIGMELLLRDSRQSLPVILDEMASLGQKLGVARDTTIELTRDLTDKVMNQESGVWRKVLGPEHLLDDGIATSEMVHIPSELWWESVTIILRMLTGLHPAAYCQHAGDVPGQSLHAIYRRPVDDLRDLLHRIRALIFPDSQHNAEVQAEIQEWLASLP